MALKLAHDEGFDRGPLGVTREEVASRPGLMLDLLTALLARRFVTCQGVIALLGDNALGKVQSRITTAREALANLSPRDGNEQLSDVTPKARDLALAIALLEDSLFALVAARMDKFAERSLFPASR